MNFGVRHMSLIFCSKKDSVEGGGGSNHVV